jgi:hypothetical protein
LISQKYSKVFWNEIVEFDLGNRILDILHTPGHEQNGTDISIYDRNTGVSRRKRGRREKEKKKERERE